MVLLISFCQKIVKPLVWHEKDQSSTLTVLVDDVNGAQDNTFSCRKPRGWVTHVASGLASCVSLSKKPSFICFFFSRHSTLVKTTLCLIYCYTFCLKTSFRLSTKLFTLTLLLKLFYLTNFLDFFRLIHKNIFPF